MLLKALDAEKFAPDAFFGLSRKAASEDLNA
jgi:hypothetical protein